MNDCLALALTENELQLLETTREPRKPVYKSVILETVKDNTHRF